MKEYKKRMESLYALKCVAAFFVVVIHFPMSGKETLEPLIRIAVPLFYLVSGFFLYAESQHKEINKAWKWIRKAIVYSLSLNVFYALWCSCVLHGTINGRMVFSALLSGEGICVPLWYLTAMWQGLVLFIVLRKWKEKWLFVVPLLCCLNPILGRYCFLYMDGDAQLPTFVRTNCITVALPYMSMGYLASKYALAGKWGKIQYPIAMGGGNIC